LRGQTMYPLCGQTDRWMDRQTDGRTDRQTDRQGETYIPPQTLFVGGIKTLLN